MNLESIREEIDRVDSSLLNLLNERMELVLAARRHKARVEDPEREKELFEGLENRATPLLSREFIGRAFGEIVRESKALQGREHRLIGFQGEHGAYSELAAQAWDGGLVPMPCHGFADVFERVESGLYDYGIVPVENTLGGAVDQVNRLLIRSDLRIMAAVELPVHLCLLVLPDTNHREIRAVYSHPKALAQCRMFLNRNRLEPIHYPDTAGAAKMLSEKRPRGSAAIASEACARLYRLDVLKENIEDLDRNVTRFVVLAREDGEETGNKCSVVFSTEHKAGTLFRVLEVFAGEGISLTRIESIPARPGTYAFFVDFLGSIREKKVKDALERAKKVTSRFRLMGCYQEVKVP